MLTSYRPYNSTITRKTKTCKRCGEDKFIFSKGLCNECWKIENYQEIPDESDDELKMLVNELDDVFSTYIRLKYADAAGNVKCYTCETVQPYKHTQNGHFIPRGNMYLRFDERNCRPQCCFCNQHKAGNIPVFTQRLNEEHSGITDMLYEEMKTVYKYSRFELKNLIVHYKKQIQFLKEDKGL